MIELTIKRFDNNIMQIENIGTVQKWNNDNEQYGSLNEWVKDIPQHSTTIHKRICLKNAILFGKNSGDFEKNSLGVAVFGGNNCQYNQTAVIIFTNLYDNGTGYQPFIYPQNFNRVIASYSVRMLIQQNWLNDKDEYRVPSDVI